MIRIVAENLLLFLLPSLAYIGYRMLLGRKSPAGGGVFDDAPIIWLFVAGAMMVVVSLVFSASTSGGRPGEAYVPPVLRDGRIVPGHTLDSSKRQQRDTAAPESPAAPAAPPGKGG